MDGGTAKRNGNSSMARLSDSEEIYYYKDEQQQLGKARPARPAIENNEAPRYDHHIAL